MILAIDTATRWLGLALHDETAVVAEVGWRCLNNHTTELTPAIQKLMTNAAVDIDAVDAIAVAIGPGSYTGLRVGLAVAKGLSLAGGVPLIGVPTLDIVAASFGPQTGQLLVAAEAGRTRVCTALYAWQEGSASSPAAGWQATSAPTIDAWHDLLARLDGHILFTGEINPKAAELIRESSPSFRLAQGATAVRRAGYLAEIGWQRLRRGELDDPMTLAPIYLRSPAGA